MTLVSCFDAPLRRNTADIGSWPGYANTWAALGRRVVVSCDTEATPHQHSEDWQVDLGEGHHPLTTFTDGAIHFVFDADSKARVIDEVQDWQMESVADIKVPFQFVAAICGQRATVFMAGIRRDDAHGMSIDAKQTGNLVSTPVPPDFKKRILVGDKTNCFTDVKSTGSAARYNGQQFFFASVHRITAGRDRWWFIDACWQIGQKLSRHERRFFF